MQSSRARGHRCVRCGTAPRATTPGTCNGSERWGMAVANGWGRPLPLQVGAGAVPGLKTHTMHVCGVHHWRDSASAHRVLCDDRMNAPCGTARRHVWCRSGAEAGRRAANQRCCRGDGKHPGDEHEDGLLRTVEQALMVATVDINMPGPTVSQQVKPPPPTT